MENNKATSGKFNSEQDLDKVGSHIGDHNQENFDEFKHCVLLHEKGVEMQEDNDSINPKIARVKHKSVAPSNANQRVNPFAKDFEEANELKLRFKEKHI